MDFQNVRRRIRVNDYVSNKVTSIFSWISLIFLIVFVLLASVNPNLIHITVNYTFAQSDSNNDDNNGNSENTDDKTHIYNLRIGYKSYQMKYSITGGELINMTIPRADILEVFIKPSHKGSITVYIPPSLSPYKDAILDIEALRKITLNFDVDNTSVKVMGLTKVPEYVDPNSGKNPQSNEDRITDIQLEHKNVSIIDSNISLNLSISDIPKVINLIDPGWEDYNLTLRAVINKGNVTYLDDYEPGSAEVLNWNPLLVFQVPHLVTGLGLRNIGHIAITPIKLYEDAEEMLKNTHFWKNIALNDEIVLRMANRGLNSILAEVQFSNGMKGIYAGGFTVDVHETKSEGMRQFNEDRSRDKELVVKEFKFSSESSDIDDIEFTQTAQNINCAIHNKQGFQFCF